MRARDRGRLPRLTRRYVAALAAVAVLSILGQALIQVMLARHDEDSRVINVAGRQGMLSQRICKAALALLYVRNPDNLELYRSELAEITAQWRRAHEGLQRGDAGLGLTGTNSREAREIYQRIQPSFDTMLAAARSLAQARRGDPAEPVAITSAVSRLLLEESAFLDGMEQIVNLYQREAEARVAELRRVELVLLALVLLALLLEGLFVFRPAARRIRYALRALADAMRESRDIGERVQMRIGRDIHDDLCQHLAGVRMVVQSLAVRAEQGDAVAPSELRALSELADQALVTASGVARGLHPAVLSQRGLPTALIDLAETADQWSDISVTCAVDTERLDIGDDVALQLYRIAQEAVGNAVRHSGASRVELALAAQGDRLELMVTDDGHGLPDPLPTDGMGLRTMTSRARLLGADLSVEPATPRGTRVVCRLVGDGTQTSEHVSENMRDLASEHASVREAYIRRRRETERQRGAS